MEIQTQSASIDTLSVTIKTLHVNGKQMTLAVFRQLPTSIETTDSEVWGVVRYSIRDEGSVWIVFSQNGVLKRRALDLSKPYDYDASRIERLKNTAERFRQYVPEQLTKAQQELDEAITERNNRMAEESQRYEKDQRLSLMGQLFIAV